MHVEASNTHFIGASRCMDNTGRVNLVGARSLRHDTMVG
jgi:hypothetical protein